MELRDWQIEECWDEGYYIRGSIYNDSKGRFSDGVRVNTSKLESIDFTTWEAKTRNSTYKLEVQ